MLFSSFKNRRNSPSVPEKGSRLNQTLPLSNKKWVDATTALHSKQKIPKGGTWTTKQIFAASENMPTFSDYSYVQINDSKSFQKRDDSTIVADYEDSPEKAYGSDNDSKIRSLSPQGSGSLNDSKHNAMEIRMEMVQQLQPMNLYERRFSPISITQNHKDRAHSAKLAERSFARKEGLNKTLNLSRFSPNKRPSQDFQKKLKNKLDSLNDPSYQMLDNDDDSDLRKMEKLLETGNFLSSERFAKGPADPANHPAYKTIGGYSPITNDTVLKEGSLIKYFRAAKAARPKSTLQQRQNKLHEILSFDSRRSSRMNQSLRGRKSVNDDSKEETMDHINLVRDVDNFLEITKKRPSSIDAFVAKVNKFMQKRDEQEIRGSFCLDESTLQKTSQIWQSNSKSLNVTFHKADRYDENRILNFTMTPETSELLVNKRTSEQDFGLNQDSLLNLRERIHNVLNEGNNTSSAEKPAAIQRPEIRAFMKEAQEDEDTETNRSEFHEQVLVPRKNSQGHRDSNIFSSRRNSKADLQSNSRSSFKSKEHFRRESSRRLIKKKNDDHSLSAFSKKEISHPSKVEFKQMPVRPNPDALMNFGKDFNDMKEIRSSMRDAKRDLDMIQISMEHSYQNQRERLEKAKLTSNTRLTNFELDFIKREFEEIGPEGRQIDQIDEMLRRLKFFNQLSKVVRTNFYKSSHYIKYPTGHFIFHQGDPGDLMYVILKGSVNVKIRKGNLGGKGILVTIASLFDGSHFGELAILSTNTKPTLVQKGTDEAPQNENDEQKPPAQSQSQQKRSASIECAEETELLAISREKFQDILLSVMNKDLDTKIRVLRQLSFYRGEGTLDLMPVANNLKTIKYKLGQKIIEAGEVLMNFYIVGRGKCKVPNELYLMSYPQKIVHDIDDEYSVDPSIYRPKLKPFKHKDVIDASLLDGKQPSAQKKLSNRRHHLPKSMRRTFDSEWYVEDKNSTNTKNTRNKFMKHLNFKELIVGDAFGFRPLVRPEDDAKYKQNPEARAKLSVIADSPEVEIYCLPRGHLIFMPERIRHKLIEGIEKLVDFDEQPIDKEVFEHRAWRDYQLNLINRTLIMPEHPNLLRPKETFKVK